MNIGINLLFLIPGKVGGTEIFARNIISELSKIDKKNNYFLYLNDENLNLFKDLPKNFNIVHCKFNAIKRFKRVIWEQLVLPFQCYFNKIDVLHSLGYTAPIITHCPKVTSIYDLNYHFFPEDFTFANLFVFKILIPLVAFTSKKIIVHSHKTKRDMISVFKLPANRIAVEYGGVSSSFYKKYTKKQVIDKLKRYKVLYPFIFSAATSHPHKNLKSLVMAYKYLVNKYNIKHKLLLLGFSGRGQGELESLLSDEALKNRVIFTGWVDPSDMPFFYKAADVFVFPSLYEGFGLPIVESMAAGVPLITSKASCIPEIVDKGGLIVNTRDINELAEAIRKVINNKKISNKLIKLGIERSRIFDWAKLAKFNLDLYEKTAI